MNTKGNQKQGILIMLVRQKKLLIQDTKFVYPDPGKIAFFLFSARQLRKNVAYRVIDRLDLIGMKLFVAAPEEWRLNNPHSALNSKGSNTPCFLAANVSRMNSIGRSGLSRAAFPIFAQ
jgi:hypothetical protein